MTNNDSITTPERCPECYGTNGHHNTLHERYGNGAGGNKPCPLNNPEGTHMNTPHPGKRSASTRIPRSVSEITIKRSPYPDTPNPLSITLTGDTWIMKFHTTDDELLTRINEIAAAMEAVK